MGLLRVSVLIQELESLVRAGYLGKARQSLRKVNLKRIPRDEAVSYANLARRVGLSQLSLKILNPIVRAERRLGKPATVSEKIEYAASLRNLGAVSEAAEILSSIDADRHPQAGFHHAICLISEWRYAHAVPLLRDYARSFKTPSYAMYVGKINLLEALIHEGRYEEARQLVSELRRELAPSKFSLHRHRTLVLAAQLEIFMSGDFDHAIRYLQEAARGLEKEQDSVHGLLILKWLAIARSLKSGKVAEDLSGVRDQAIELGQWETVRDCDFYKARISGDAGALTRLYFGTPFESYRARILSFLDPDSRLPEVYLWNGDRKPGRDQVFDLAMARERRGSVALTPGQALHRLLITLCRDFYRPAPLLSLFSRLFPGEHFDPDTSPNRIHHMTVRMREWIRSAALPLELQEISGNYRLRFAGPFAIAIPRETLPLSQRELEFIRLRSLLDQDCFTIRDALRVAGVSKSTLNLLLKWAVENGKVELQGRTRRARYKLIA